MKVKTQQDAINRLFEWRTDNGQCQIPTFGQVKVLQKPHKHFKIANCYNNAYSAPKEYDIVAGWLVSKRPFKFKIGKNKEIKGFSLTPHYWNALITPFGQFHIDFTPFAHKGNKFNGGLFSEFAYVVDRELYDFPRRCDEIGISISAVAPSFLLEDDGDFIEIRNDILTPNILTCGSLPLIYHDVCYPGGKLHPNIEKLLEES